LEWAPVYLTEKNHKNHIIFSQLGCAVSNILDKTFADMREINMKWKLNLKSIFKKIKAKRKEYPKNCNKG